MDVRAQRDQPEAPSPAWLGLDHFTHERLRGLAEEDLTGSCSTFELVGRRDRPSRRDLVVARRDECFPRLDRDSHLEEDAVLGQEAVA